MTVTSVGTITGAGGVTFGTTTGSTVTTGVGFGGTGGIPNPDDCAVQYRYEGSDWCEIDYNCSGSWLWASCYGDSGDAWDCNCSSAYFGGSYLLTGVDNSEACPLTASLCMDPEQIDFTEPAMCSPVYQEQQSNYCSMEVQCTQSEEISENVTAQLREWQWIYCYGSGGAWDCQCNSDNVNIGLTIEDVENSNMLCSDMLDVCNSGDLQAEGPKTCEPRSQSSERGYCYAEQQCSQEATVQGANVLVNSYIYTDCRESSEGQWTCDCYTAPGSTSFTIASTDSWEACTEASDACAVAAGAE